MKEQFDSLTTNFNLLKQRVRQEVVHHHNATKSMWIAAVLFLMVCLLSTAWYLTNSRLKVYKANDTKYRYLKLHASKGLSKVLYFIDSIYIKDVNMGDMVIEKEEQKVRSFLSMQQVLQIGKEGTHLKQHANSKKKNNGKR